MSGAIFPLAVIHAQKIDSKTRPYCFQGIDLDVEESSNTFLFGKSFSGRSVCSRSYWVSQPRPSLHLLNAAHQGSCSAAFKWCRLLHRGTVLKSCLKLLGGETGYASSPRLPAGFTGRCLTQGEGREGTGKPAHSSTTARWETTDKQA